MHACLAMPCHAMLLGHSCDKRTTLCKLFMALSVWFVVVCVSIYLSMCYVKCIFEIRDVEGVVRT